MYFPPMYLLLTQTANKQRQTFPDTVRQLLALGEQVRICFDPKPKKGRVVIKGKKKKLKDNKFWEGYVAKPPFPQTHDLVIRVRRPINPSTPSYEALHDKEIMAVDQNELSDSPGNVQFTPIYLKLIEGVKVAKRRVAAVNRIAPISTRISLSKRKRRYRRASDISEDDEVVEFDSEDSDDEFSNVDYDSDGDLRDDPDELAVQSVVATAGHSTPSHRRAGSSVSLGPDMNAWQRDVIQGISLKQMLSVNMPIVKFLDGVQPAWINAVLSVLTPREAKKLEPLLRHGLPLGVLPITGIPGGGKTFLLASLAMLCFGSRDHNRLMCCGPTHAAADALARKLEQVAGRILEVFNRDSSMRKRRPLLVRAYHDRAEVEAVLYIVKNNGTIPQRDSNP